MPAEIACSMSATSRQVRRRQVRTAKAKMCRKSKKTPVVLSTRGEHSAGPAPNPLKAVSTSRAVPRPGRYTCGLFHVLGCSLHWHPYFKASWTNDHLLALPRTVTL